MSVTRIPELPLINTANGNDRLAIWNSNDNVTYGILISILFPASTDVFTITWNETNTYFSGDVVFFEDAFFKSLIDDNYNNIPEDGAIWEIVITSVSGLVYWQAGLFINNPSCVLYDDGSTIGLYTLTAPIPYNSTNFATELLAGDWQIVGQPASSTPGLPAVLAVNNDAGALKIVNLGNPTNPQDADTMSARDAAITSALAQIKWKQSYRVATVVALPANTANGTYQTLTGNVNGALSAQDGITLALNETIVVKNEVDQKKNGLFKLTQVGSAGTPYILTRTIDGDSGSELSNAVVPIEEGTSNADTTWRQTNDNIIIGTTNIVFAAFGGSVPDASTSVKGVVQLDTDGNIQANTNPGRVVTSGNLAAWWTWVKTQAQTFAAVITFTSAPRFSSTTASQTLEVNATKDLISVAKATAYNKDFATNAETITGTETLKPVPPSALTAWWADIKTKVATITAMWTITDVTLSGQSGTANRESYLDSTGKIIRNPNIGYNTTTGEKSINGLDNSSSTYSFSVFNLAGDTVARFSNGQKLEVGGAVCEIEVPSGTTAGNAYITFRDLTGEQFALKDASSNRYQTFEKDGGGVRLIKFLRQLIFDRSIGMAVIADQMPFVLPNTTAGVAHVVKSISVPVDYMLIWKARHIGAYATDGSVLSVDSLALVARNVAGTVTVASNVIVHQKLPGTLTSVFTVVVNGTAIELKFTNDTGAGKAYTIWLDDSYTLIAKPI